MAKVNVEDIQDEDRGTIWLDVNKEYRFPRDAIEPDWGSAGWVHEWKNYISEDLQRIWGTFTAVQKALIAESAQQVADSEEWD